MATTLALHQNFGIVFSFRQVEKRDASQAKQLGCMLSKHSVWSLSRPAALPDVRVFTTLAISERVRSDVRLAPAIATFQTFLSSALMVLGKFLSGF